LVFVPAIPVQTGMMQDFRNELTLIKKAVRKISWNAPGSQKILAGTRTRSVS
jgi:hypothetical protein